jgi:FkbM family methyltransferase
VPASEAVTRLQRIFTEDSRLIYVDCGARKGKLPRPFRALKTAQYIGVEADADECARLNAEARPRHRYIQAFLGRSAETRMFRMTRNPACASLLEPNHEFLAQFREIAEGFQVERHSSVQTVALDECLAANGVDRADFLELDVQGGELEVLTGADRTLNATLGIETEVEFAPMYVDQPLFADIDRFLRGRGFQLFDLSRYHVRRSNPGGASTRGQLLWGHALYLRDYRGLAPELAARLAMVATVLELPDLAADIVTSLMSSMPADSQRLAARALDAIRNATEGTAQDRPVWRD